MNLEPDDDEEIDPMWEEAWEQEAERRYQELQKGIAIAIPSEVVLREARLRLAAQEPES